MDGWIVVVFGCVLEASCNMRTRAKTTRTHTFVLTSLTIQTRVVDRFMKNILKYVEDGMDDV